MYNKRKTRELPQYEVSRVCFPLDEGVCLDSMIEAKTEEAHSPSSGSLIHVIATSVSAHVTARTSSSVDEGKVMDETDGLGLQAATILEGVRRGNWRQEMRFLFQLIEKNDLWQLSRVEKIGAKLIGDVYVMQPQEVVVVGEEEKPQEVVVVAEEKTNSMFMVLYRSMSLEVKKSVEVEAEMWPQEFNDFTQAVHEMNVCGMMRYLPRAEDLRCLIWYSVGFINMVFGGVEVIHNDKGIFILDIKYITMKLARFQLLCSNAMLIQIMLGFKFTIGESGVLIINLQVAKGVMTYLMGIVELATWCRRGGEEECLMRFIKHSYAYDVDAWTKSIHYLLFLMQAVVSWKLSTIEIKYVAAAYCATNYNWLTRILKETTSWKGSMVEGIEIHCGIRSIIKKFSNPEFMAK
ncbi:unnamed protein product [Linum trigynum]|uniref:Uncharacterized protein n=1 Tax=Linum trigynum TaxID=586398 RepID=A0AAV2EY93_9ROSI